MNINKRNTNTKENESFDGRMAFVLREHRLGWGAGSRTSLEGLPRVALELHLNE